MTDYTPRRGFPNPDDMALPPRLLPPPRVPVREKAKAVE